MKMIKVSSLFKLVALAFFGSLFMYKTIVGVKKLNQKRIGTETSYRPASNLTMPDLTICPGNPYASDVAATHSDNFNNFLLTLRRTSLEAFSLLTDYSVSEDHNLLNTKEVEEDLGMDFPTLWSENLETIEGQLVYCMTYHPPRESELGREAQTVSVIGLGTAGDEDSSGPTRLVNKVFFHHRGHAYPSNLEVFGRSKIIPDIGADAEEDKSVRFTYELHLTEKRFLSRNDRPCAEEGYTEVRRCFDNYVARQADCELPWLHQGQNTSFDEGCKKQGIVHKIGEIYKNMSAINDSDRSCEELAACPLAWSPSTPPSRPTAQRGKTEVTVEKEFLIYDFFSLTAEVGGYMGLLLGFSLLSIFESVVDHLVVWRARLSKR